MKEILATLDMIAVKVLGYKPKAKQKKLEAKAKKVEREKKKREKSA